MFNKKQLRGIKLRDFTDCSYYDLKMSGYKLLHGYCDAFALCLAGDLKENGYTVKVVRAESDSLGICYVHQYCVIKINNETELYADVRGIFRDYNQFMKEFLSFESRELERKFELSEISVSDLFDYENGPQDIWQELGDMYTDDYKKESATALSRAILDDYYNDFLSDIEEIKEELEEQDGR